MEDEISDLVRLARRGDRGAFDELVRRTYRDTYTLARRLCNDDEDARDVVQDAYLKAYRGLKRFRGDAKFSTWMYRITANCAHDQLARRQKHRHDELLDTWVDESPDHDPERHAEAASFGSDLGHALDNLSPALRSVVVLRDVYDMSHEEMARELGISVSAAKVRLHRARLALKEQLYGTARIDSNDASVTGLGGAWSGDVSRSVTDVG